MLVAASYWIERRDILMATDERLRMGNVAAGVIYQEWMDAGLPEQKSLAGPDWERKLRLLNGLAGKLKLDSIYGMVREEGKVVFVLSTTLNVDSETAPPIYGRVYERPSKKLLEAFAAGEVRTDTYEDEYGRYRSHFAPQELPDGRLVVWGSDVRKSAILREFLITLGMNIAVLVVVSVFSVWIVWRLSRRVSRPLDLLSRATARLVHNDFRATPALLAGLGQVRGRSCRELERLSDSVLVMQGALQEYLMRMEEEVGRRKRMESELEIAREIQQSLLPSDRAAGGEGRARFEAFLEPAREIGGDLFDFQAGPDGCWYFTIGDVSGKGVPAALLMAVVQTLWKRSIQDGDRPAAALGRINRSVCQGGHNGMFVTMWAGRLDPASGELEWANAGHSPPVRISPGGRMSRVGGPSGLVVGVLDSTIYQTGSVELGRGDALLFFTDGLTETQDPGGRFYEETQMEADLAVETALGVVGLPARVATRLAVFRSTAPVRDDLTLLSVVWKG